jgi:predicted nucleic acid-binding protein
MSSMPERSAVLVSNTTPLIALTAALGSLDILKYMYVRVLVPFEVAQEVRAGGQTSFGVDAFQAADWLDIQDRPVTLLPFLKNSLDAGEASVIQTALNLSLPLVCIDEVVGRRTARLCGLNLTGSLGILLKARQLGFSVDLPHAIENMRRHGIWLSPALIASVLGNPQ